MFEHITILLSFVFAIALTHLFTSATEMIWARDRVVFSGLHALWMLIALIGLVVNWLSFWNISIDKHLDVIEVELWFTLAGAQYFTCSLVAMRVREEGLVDIPAFYDRQRPMLFIAYIALVLVSGIINYWDRNHTVGIAPTEWIAEDAALVPMLLAALGAGWAKAKWLQWLCGLTMLALILYFLSQYTLPA